MATVSKEYGTIDSIEYRCLVTNQSSIVLAIQNDILSVGAHLLASGLISENTYEKLLIPSVSEIERALDLMTDVIHRIKLQPDHYHVFINVLLKEWNRYDSVLRILYDTYQLEAIKERAKVDQPSSETTMRGTSTLTKEKDSVDVEGYLERLRRGALVQLGCVLGLSYSRIKSMEQLSRGVTYSWLEKEDNVLKQMGEPTWPNLIFALQMIKQSSLASTIIDEKKVKLPATDERKTIQHIVAETGVPPEALSNSISDEVLLKSFTLCDKWQSIGLQLGVPDIDIQSIKENFKTSDERMVRIMESWRIRDGPKATYRQLIEVLLKSGDAKLAVEVCKAIKAATTGDYRLHEKDFIAIYENLKSCASKWKEIGTALGFKSFELDMIQSNPMLRSRGSSSSFLSHMLSEWLQWGPGDGRGSDDYATFGNLSAALWKANMGALVSDLPQGEDPNFWTAERRKAAKRKSRESDH